MAKKRKNKTRNETTCLPDPLPGPDTWAGKKEGDLLWEFMWPVNIFIILFVNYQMFNFVGLFFAPDPKFYVNIFTYPGSSLRPLTVPLLLVASVLSLVLKLLYKIMMATMKLIRMEFYSHGRNTVSQNFILEPIWCSFLLLKIASQSWLDAILGTPTNWKSILDFALEHGYSFFVWTIGKLPWPKGDSHKLFVLASRQCHKAVENMTTMENNETTEDKRAREGSLELRRYFDDIRNGICLDQSSYFIDHADLNFRNSEGRAYLFDIIDMCGDSISFDLLTRTKTFLLIDGLDDGADPNMKDFENGSTLLHYAVRKGDTESILVLRNYRGKKSKNYANLSALDDEGRTPYMLLHEVGLVDKAESRETREYYSSHRILEQRPDLKVINGVPVYQFLQSSGLMDVEVGANILEPRPSWKEVEGVLLTEGATLEETCKGIKKIIAENNDGSRDLRHLQLLDMLFCEKAGDNAALTERRITVFEKFLKPALLRSVEKPKIGNKLKKMLHFFFNESGGYIPSRQVISRLGYHEQFSDVLQQCSEGIEKLYGAEYNRLLAEDIDMDTLLSIPKKECFLVDKELNHGRFTTPPWWAIHRDLPGAIRGLQEAGVLDSPNACCDLFQNGSNKLLPEPERKLFIMGPKEDQFWQALVLLWSIGLQKKIEDDFISAMYDVAGNAFSKAPGVKAFRRSWEKALEYADEKGLNEWEDKVAAGLHVIDGLRCSFVVDTAEENLKIGRRLQKRFPVVRSKNGHQRDNRSYADRKFNLVYTAVAEGAGEVAFICEVQILMRGYIEIKKIGHLLYEYERSLPVNKVSRARRLKKARKN